MKISIAPQELLTSLPPPLSFFLPCVCQLSFVLTITHRPGVDMCMCVLVVPLRHSPTHIFSVFVKKRKPLYTESHTASNYSWVLS